MTRFAEDILEFNTIKQMLAEYAMSAKAKKQALELSPYFKERECRRRLQETTDARHVLDGLGAPPLASMEKLGDVVLGCEKDAMLLPEQLEAVAVFAVTCRRLSGYLKRAQALEPSIGLIGQSLSDLSALQGEIEHAIRGGRVNPDATPALSAINRKLETADASIKSKLESLLRSKRQWFSDGYIAVRNGRFVLPVKREYKNQINGTVVDTSSTGGTCFMEPSSVTKLQGEIAALRVEEDNEIRKILYTLTALVDDCLPQMKWNMDAMETVDFLFAKAKLSAQMDAVEPELSMERRICLRQARHPLLDKAVCVPLDYTMGGEVQGVIVTGPNTGGKTVALKTVGLLSLMAQCGLHIPAARGSVAAMHSAVLCDIGDGQSITQNLSTFSAHMTSVIRILEQAGPESLVLLDELGSGTDPAEGMGIAVAVLEELRARGCLFLVTTHYPEVKTYAEKTPGLCNARMAFDRESLKPLYTMEIGQAGESCALYIAKRLGLPATMLRRAYQEAYQLAEVPQSLLQDAAGRLERVRNPKLEQELPPEAENKVRQFQIGDSVRVSPSNELGIVYRPADGQGMVTVQVKGVKKLFRHNRVKLEVSAEKLYPPDYDFSILFDTVENRKARHKMGKGHQPDLTVTCEEAPTE